MILARAIYFGIPWSSAIHYYYYYVYQASSFHIFEEVNWKSIIGIPFYIDVLTKCFHSVKAYFCSAPWMWLWRHNRMCASDLRSIVQFALYATEVRKFIARHTRNQCIRVEYEKYLPQFLYTKSVAKPGRVKIPLILPAQKCFFRDRAKICIFKINCKVKLIHVGNNVSYLNMSIS